jgi:hypothetical protein
MRCGFHRAASGYAVCGTTEMKTLEQAGGAFKAMNSAFFTHGHFAARGKFFAAAEAACTCAPLEYQPENLRASRL